eukprot:414321_1
MNIGQITDNERMLPYTNPPDIHETDPIPMLSTANYCFKSHNKSIRTQSPFIRCIAFPIHESNKPSSDSDADCFSLSYTPMFDDNTECRANTDAIDSNTPPSLYNVFVN